jgi:hypothetical protein
MLGIHDRILTVIWSKSKRTLFTASPPLDVNTVACMVTVSDMHIVQLPSRGFQRFLPSPLRGFPSGGSRGFRVDSNPSGSPLRGFQRFQSGLQSEKHEPESSSPTTRQGRTVEDP